MTKKADHPKKKPCSVRGCKTSAHRRGYCSKHYRRWAEYGDPTAGPPLNKNAGGPCDIPKCETSAVYKNKCRRHYNMFRKYGSLEKVIELEDQRQAKKAEMLERTKHQESLKAKRKGQCQWGEDVGTEHKPCQNPPKLGLDDNDEPFIYCGTHQRVYVNRMERYEREIRQRENSLALRREELRKLKVGQAELMASRAPYLLIRWPLFQVIQDPTKDRTVMQHCQYQMQTILRQRGLAKNVDPANIQWQVGREDETDLLGFIQVNIKLSPRRVDPIHPFSVGAYQYRGTGVDIYENRRRD